MRSTALDPHTHLCPEERHRMHRGHRAGQRSQRERAGLPFVAIIGYTNAAEHAGHRLTPAGALAETSFSLPPLIRLTRRVRLPVGQRNSCCQIGPGFFIAKLHPIWWLRFAATLETRIGRLATSRVRTSRPERRHRNVPRDRPGRAQDLGVRRTAGADDSYSRSSRDSPRSLELTLLTRGPPTSVVGSPGGAGTRRAARTHRSRPRSRVFCASVRTLSIRRLSTLFPSQGLYRHLTPHRQGDADHRLAAGPLSRHRLSDSRFARIGRPSCRERHRS